MIIPPADLDIFLLMPLAQFIHWSKKHCLSGGHQEERPFRLYRGPHADPGGVEKAPVRGFQKVPVPRGVEKNPVWRPQ